MAARDVAQALKSLASAARGVAATTEDTAARNAMLDCAGDVMDKSANLIEETKRAMAKPGDAESQQRLAQVGLSAGAWGWEGEAEGGLIVEVIGALVIVVPQHQLIQFV